jgi:hypothetical protein
MRILILKLLIVGTALHVSAQDPAIKAIKTESQRKSEKDTTLGWKTGGVVSVNVGQGSSKNWAAGAEEFSFSTAWTVSLFANLTRENWHWNTTLDLGYAIVNTRSDGTKKTDDKIDLFSKLGRDLSDEISFAGVINFRSQFAPGYDYDYLDQDLKRATSAFFAPAYLIVAPGFDWHPESYFSIFISPVTLRMVFVTNDPKSYYYPNGAIPTGGFEDPRAILYGVDPARQVRTEFGAYLSANFNKEIFKNVSYKSRFDLYSNFLKATEFTVTGPDQVQTTEVGAKPQNIDILWTNLIAMKINTYLSVTYNLDLIYDDDVKQFGDDDKSAATQIRSLLAVGFSLKF